MHIPTAAPGYAESFMKNGGGLERDSEGIPEEEEKKRDGGNPSQRKGLEREREREIGVVFSLAVSRGLQESEIDVNIRSLLNKTRETKSHRKTSV